MVRKTRWPSLALRACGAERGRLASRASQFQGNPFSEDGKAVMAKAFVVSTDGIALCQACDVEH